MATTQDFTPNSIVLVTGANGHVAQHVVSQLLSRPEASRPRVRATVRSDSSATALKSVFSDSLASGQLEIVQIPDITVASAFDDALKSVTHIAHIASPLPGADDDTEKDLLIPAIRGTTELLKSASSKCPNLESVVITSSFAAYFDAMHGLRPGYTYTPDDWNPITYSVAASPDLDLSTWPQPWSGFIPYMASKTLAERAAWDFYSSLPSKPNWALSTIAPVYIGGPAVLPLTKADESLSFSNQLIWTVATSGSGKKLPEIDFPNWVDVRDVAKAHIAALITPKARGQRFIVSSYHGVSYSDIADIVRKEFGDKFNPSEEKQEVDAFKIDSPNNEKILGIKKGDCVPFEDMVRETLQQVLDAQG